MALGEKRAYLLSGNCQVLSTFIVEDQSKYGGQDTALTHSNWPVEKHPALFRQGGHK